jgi:trimeric autotransporter adhesin
MKLGLLVVAIMDTALCGACASSTSSPNVSAIGVSPSPCAVGRTDSQQMSASATLPDGTKKDVTSVSSWSTGNANTATVNASGIVVGVNAGVTKVTASYEGATGSVDCAVGP